MFIRAFLILLAMVGMTGLSQVSSGQQLSRQEKLEKDRERARETGIWIYNDLQRGFRQAKETGKPLMVVLRCVPCDECVKLDDDLVERDEEIAKLLDSFVCVRQVSTNGLDLSIFQFDTDQSFAIFFLNADGTIYGRFGTRSHRTEWIGDVSIEAMAEAMKAALALHTGYPANREMLAGKQGVKPDVASPERYPSLRDKYSSTLKTGNEQVASCIHCHQIGDAQRELYWTSGKRMPDEVIFQYPHPKIIGLIMDPYTRSTVKEIVSNSPAQAAGFKTGDELISIQGQPLISIADIQWALHRFPNDGGEIRVEISRSGAKKQLTLSLPEGWRTEDDLSWRVSSWGLRRMLLGGLVLKLLGDEERSKNDIRASEMALLVDHVGQYDAHAAAKKAGFKKGDIVLSYDGREDLGTESDIFYYALTKRRIGDRVKIDVLRSDKRMTLEIPIQQ